jgi:outer membrane protein assembly factor BamB
VRRAALAVAALALLAAACSSEDAGEAEPTASVPEAVATGAEAPVETEPAESPPPERPREALVTVVDGDLGTRVAGADVTVAAEAGSSDERGLARVPLTRKGSLVVDIEAPGYVSKRVRLDFRDRRRYTIRVYQEALQWPFYGATFARTQAQPHIELRPPFRTVWSRGVGSLVEFPAVVWEGVAYVNTLEGILYALSMRDGRVLWSQQAGTKTASSPAIDPVSRTLVLTTMEPGDFQVRDLRNGKLLWSLPTGLTEPSPIVRDGVAYFAATNGDVYAVDLERREPRWTYAGGSKITSSPAVVGNRLYVGDYAGRVLCLDARDGTLIWSGSAGSKVYGTVAVAGGRVFAPAVGSGLAALSAGDGSLLWRVPTGSYTYASPAVDGGRVFFADYGGNVYAAAAASGEVLWRGDAGGSVSGALTVVDGVVYAGSFAGRITGWNTRTGEEVLRFPHGEYVPVSGNGGRLLFHGFSRIYAVEPTG